jgi:hypothetical protein
VKNSPSSCVAASERKLHALQILARIGMWLWPALTLGTWLFLEHLPVQELQRLAGMIRPSLGASVAHDPTFAFHITWKVKLAGAGAALFPAAVQFLFMRQWVSLFGFYREGRIFATETVRCFSLMGRHLLALSLFDIALSMPLHSLVLTLDNPPGKRMLTLGFSSDDVPVLATGIALVVIAWAMEEGRKLRQEADLII